MEDKLKNIVILLVVAVIFSATVRLTSDIPEATDRVDIAIVDGSDTLFTESVSRGEDGFTVDIPAEIPIRSTIVVHTDERTFDEPLYRGLDITETEELGLNIGYPGEHVEFVGDYLDLLGRKLNNVATPTTSDSTTGSAVSTGFILGPVKSNSQSYKLYSK